MKRLTTLTTKNLPRLAVAKPGWPDMVGEYRADYSPLDNPIPDDPETERLLKRSTITPQAAADFTRVCDQTGLSEKLRINVFTPLESG